MDELDRARAYASGRLELRLEESRHVSAWLGVQEALHDRVLTLDEALAELAEVTPEAIQALAQRAVPRRPAVHVGHRATRHDNGLEKALHLTERGTMNERTLILIKPDGVQRALIGKIVDRYEERGLRIVGMKMVHADRALAEQHYDVHREKPFFAGLVEFITSGAARRDGRRGPERGRRLPRDQRRDSTSRGGAGLHPRRPGARHRAQPGPRLRLGRKRRRASWRCGSSRKSCSTTTRDLDRWVTARAD